MTAAPPVRFLHRIATGDPRRRRLLTPLGPLMFFGVIAGLIGLARLTNRLLRLPRLPAEPYNLLLGLPFLAAGAALAAWSASRFFLARGTPVPFNPPPRLVVEGPYAITRNPMMTGIFAVILGIGLFHRSPALVVIYLPLFVLLMRLVITRFEEPELELRFGEEYREYRRRTPRFLPAVGTQRTDGRAARRRG